MKLRTKRIKRNNIKTYIKSILISLSVFSVFVSIQMIFVLKTFKIHFLIVPLALACIMGYLIAKVLILKRDLEAEKRLFHAIANEAREFAYFKNLEGFYEYISPSVEELTGYTPKEFYQKKDFFYTLIVKEDIPRWKNYIDNIESSGKVPRNIEFCIRHKNGQEVWVNHNCSAVYENGEKIGYRAVNANITQRKKNELDIKHLNLYDTLTKLPNRRYIFEKFAELKKAEIPFTIIYLDLNRFKKVNDSLGHGVGDLILKNVAQNFQECTSDEIFIGRLGGDEFLIILENITQREIIDSYAKRIHSLVAKDYHIEGYTFFIGASMGVARFPDESDNAHELLANADKAMYRAKQITSLDIIYYADLIADNLFDEFLLEKELREALKNDSLEVFLQPKFNVKTQKISGYEALIRWRKNAHFISPDIFIPLAEETGLVKNITLYVIKEVFKTAKNFRDKQISINLSMLDLMSDTFIQKVQKLLLDFDVQANQFDFELTERVFFEDDEKINKNINKLIDMGFEFSLDDFGTGYSSLSYLTKLPINTLKIDKSFIDNLDTKYEKNFPLLNSIVTIANDLHFKIVVEGVERKEQLDILNSLGKFVIQGYYFYKPMPILEAQLVH